MVGTAIKKTLHRCLCDQESETHKMFVEFGFKGVVNKFSITGAVAACFYDLKIGAISLAIPVTALIIKLGLDTFCELYPVDSIMEQRKQKACSADDRI